MPRQPTQVAQTLQGDWGVDWDDQAFDDQVAAHGVTLVHYPAVRCPLGMVDLDDNRRPHPDHEGCSNGFLYEPAGTITALFSNNGLKDIIKDWAVLDGSTAVVTFERFYVDQEGQPTGHEFQALPYDRFFLAETNIVVPNWQLFKTSGGVIDRLQFPAVQVSKCLDADGKRYVLGRDFKLTPPGWIEWLPGGGRPEPDKVMSIRYTYRPFWYCASLVHEVRTTQYPDTEGTRTARLLPQQAVLAREHVFKNTDQDADTNLPLNPRLAPAAPLGILGPR